MKRLSRLTAVAALVAGLALSPALASGQTGADGLRTPWGDPDLQGVWDYWTFTPLERPEEFGERGELTAEEAAAVGSADRRPPAAALAVTRRSPPGESGYSQEV